MARGSTGKALDLIVDTAAVFALAHLDHLVMKKGAHQSVVRFLPERLAHENGWLAPWLLA